MISAMAGFRALEALGNSLVTVLNQQIAVEIPGANRPTAVLAGTGDLDQINTPGAVITFPAISIYTYRLTVDQETRPGWSSVANSDGIPRIPLRMHMLVSAWDEDVAFELRWLGLAARILETHSILTGPMLDPAGDWGDGDTVQVIPDDLAVDSMSEAFQALTTQYRLCLPYLARVIVIDGRQQALGERVSTVGARAELLP
jgi:Pvc16 N-terminal domain